MKKLLSILLSSILFFGNNVFAGGEDKIVYIDNGDKYVFVSTENIPQFVDLFQKKFKEQEDRRFSSLANCVYKSLVACAGIAIDIALYCSASKPDGEGISKAVAASGVLTTLGALVVFFVPEYINRQADKFASRVSETSVEWQDQLVVQDHRFNRMYEISDPLNAFEKLVCNLERISPAARHRDKHGRTFNQFRDTYIDPCLSDNNDGIIVRVTKNIKGQFEFIIFRQSTDVTESDYTEDGFGVLSWADHGYIDLCTNSTGWGAREERIYEFDNELFNKIFR